MNDSAIRDFCITARNDLREQVARRALLYGITAEGYVDPSADVVDGRVLAPEEIAQRKELIARFLAGPEDGYAERYEALIERAAYTWFNRLVAIRYMEVNDRLPSHVRVLSAADGSFASQAMAEALQLDIEGIDRARVAELVSAADDEALFRYLFLAQCDELASCLPDVFEPIGSAMELLLPDGLLRRGGVACQLVEDIPEQDWTEGVEIVGWMYQYYNAERKDEAFASFKKGKKAEADVLAPATQLFTPGWIVRYLVENSLGRLWLQSHPDSALADSMPYYIPDEGSVSSDSSISSPEDIAVVDPACGSGHILVYAFDLLARIYEEAGYSRRDIAQLILRHNLSGIEIDPRAAALASFALSMKGCELDSRFLIRCVFPKVTTMVPVALDEGEIESLPTLAERTVLLDAMAHASECGSLFAPESGDLIVLQRAKAELESRGDLLSSGLLDKVETMLVNCEPLARTYDVVVANPPYMGSSNMGNWLASWTKKNYPDSKRDLCTCFIERGFTLANPEHFVGMITASSWMFISSFEEFRKKLLSSGSILTMVQQSTHGYAGVTVPTCIFVYQLGVVNRVGSYIRLEDFDRPQLQKPKTEEAIANPDCGWFYRRDASAFSAIPGSPIAYWASNSLFQAFRGALLPALVVPRMGLQTGDNDRFIRFWWEVSQDNSCYGAKSVCEAKTSQKKWFPISKGGGYRKWFGNNIWVVNWENEGNEINAVGSGNSSGSDYYFLEGASWGLVSSGPLSVRLNKVGTIFSNPGPMCTGDNEESIRVALGLLNSSVTSISLGFITPTLNNSSGDLSKIPYQAPEKKDQNKICETVNLNISIAGKDYDSFEASWDFKRHPMV